jgi:hypothetical protein
LNRNNLGIVKIHHGTPHHSYYFYYYYHHSHYHLYNIEVYERIILKLISTKQGVRMWVEFISLCMWSSDKLCRQQKICVSSKTMHGTWTVGYTAGSPHKDSNNKGTLHAIYLIHQDDSRNSTDNSNKFTFPYGLVNE